MQVTKLYTWGYCTSISAWMVKPVGGAKLGTSVCSPVPGQTSTKPSTSLQPMELTPTLGQEMVEGMLTHCPRSSYCQPWYAHWMLPSMTLPRDKGQALWAQVSLTHAGSPDLFLNSTQGCPNSSKATGVSFWS